ncbi:TIGR03668 family PPOX class F420-dependent oxidoreductase [Pseudofrankia asymbiotica]|uniref:PPOX class F420-dependent oxidoreductase n=1 Tax=Pseudofrankia asymbiotica TaxID=1834516 RepID=A0A1V2I1Z0_9ACTN|nr:TIGR03668 family PPOX class F420-dependent oxidoreductase [Pseudofrankia asymbiotica]ONH23841.1 PPOX class F420-dependent oxidoreductase [Pseudofrankia asymbiotica]
MNLSEGEARARFAAARVARLATIAPDGTPRLVPVTFAVLAGPPTEGGSAAPGLGSAAPAPAPGPAPGPGPGPGSVAGGLGTVVTAVDHKPKRTTRLRRLDDIARDGRVSLLADEYDDDWSRLWWARADGVASVVEPPDHAHAVAARALVERYRQYRDHPPAGPAIVVTVTRWTGWSYR